MVLAQIAATATQPADGAAADKHKLKGKPLACSRLFPVARVPAMPNGAIW